MTQNTSVEGVTGHFFTGVKNPKKRPGGGGGGGGGVTS